MDLLLDGSSTQLGSISGYTVGRNSSTQTDNAAPQLLRPGAAGGRGAGSVSGVCL